MQPSVILYVVVGTCLLSAVAEAGDATAETVTAP